MKNPAIFLFVACSALGASCAHAPAPEAQIILPEDAAGHVAKIVTGLTGQEPYGITLPGLPPVYFEQHPSECLKVHERTHVLQEEAADKANGAGSFVWASRYASQLVTCTTSVPPAQRKAKFTVCLKEIPYEKEAYDAQHACQAAEARAP